MQIIKTVKPSTISVTLPGYAYRFELYNEKGDLYYFRDIADGQKEIKFNVQRAGTFTSNVDLFKVEINDLKINQLNTPLPKPQKERTAKQIKIVYNPNLTGTPARNFYKLGIIEVGDKFMQQPYPVKVFIICHEIGHFFYHDEELADLFAAKLYIKKGFNRSTALHALTDILNFESNVNKDRLKKHLTTLKS